MKGGEEEEEEGRATVIGELTIGRKSGEKVEREGGKPVLIVRLVLLSSWSLLGLQQSLKGVATGL